MLCGLCHILNAFVTSKSTTNTLGSLSSENDPLHTSINTFDHHDKPTLQSMVFSAIEKNDINLLTDYFSEYTVNDILKLHDSNGETLLMKAARLCKLEVVSFLLEMELDLFEESSSHWNVIHLSCTLKHGLLVLTTIAEYIYRLEDSEEIFEKMLNMSSSSNGLAPLHYAIQYNNYSIFNWLLENGVDLSQPQLNVQLNPHSSSHSNSYLKLPVSQSSLPQYLPQSKLSGSSSSTLTPFKHWSGNFSFLGSFASLSSFASGGWSYSNQNQTQNSKHILKQTSKDSLDQEAEPYLIYAAQFNRRSMFQALIERGAQLNDTDSRGNHALLVACENGSQDVIVYLIEELEIPINVTGSNKYTALHFATIRNDIQLCKYLIGEGAHVNERDENGMTPLHHACLCGYHEMAYLLVKKGADPYITDTIPTSTTHSNHISASTFGTVIPDLSDDYDVMGTTVTENTPLNRSIQSIHAGGSGGIGSNGGIGSIGGINGIGVVSGGTNGKNAFDFALESKSNYELIAKSIHKAQNELLIFQKYNMYYNSSSLIHSNSEFSLSSYSNRL